MTEATLRDAVSRFFHEMREGGRRQGKVLFALIFKFPGILAMMAAAGFGISLFTGYYANRRKVLER